MAEERKKGEAAQVKVSEAEAARLADAAALQALRDRLANADTELTAMTLALEEERKRAEETLTLLAAARVAAEGPERRTRPWRRQRRRSWPSRKRFWPRRGRWSF